MHSRMSAVWQRQCGAELVSLIRHDLQEERMMETSVFYLDMLGGEPKINDLRGRDMNEADLRQRKEKMLDKTIADSFPASDPPSSIPDPEENSFFGPDFCRDFRVILL